MEFTVHSTRLKLALGLSFLLLCILAVGGAGYLFPAIDGSMTLLIVAGVVVLCAFIIALLVFRSALLPLMQIVRYSTRIANGNYGAPFEGTVSGEYGQLKEAIDVIAAEATGQSAKSEELDNQLAMATHEKDALSRELEEVKGECDAQSRALIKGAAKLKELAELLNNATVGLSDQVDIVTDGANNQRARSGETAGAMEQMNATILDVARSAAEAADQATAAREMAASGAGVVDQVSEAVASVDEHTSRMKISVNGLGSQADDIGQIMSVITDIADQTNLLALNAAIEAARAGEAGRGFAVVADEVRKLAEKTMDATKEVGASVQAIQNGVRGSIGEMGQAAEAVEKASGLAAQADEALKEIVGIVEKSADQAQTIAAAAEEQSATSEEIMRSVEDVSETSNVMVHGMDESRTMINNLASYTSIMTDIIEDMGDGDMTSIENRDWSGLESAAVKTTSVAAPKAARASVEKPMAKATQTTTPAPARKPVSTSSFKATRPTSLMQWGPSFELGIEEIDDQHKQLVALVNELNDAMRTGKGADKLGQVFEELKEYTVHHFSTEETYFEEFQYPGMLAHVAEHKKLVDQVIDLETKFKSGRGALTTDVMHFLKDWLINHIQGVDRKYVSHMKKHGL